MDALEWSTAIYALAVTLAKNLTDEEIGFLALVLTQLGTTLGTISALGSLAEAQNENNVQGQTDVCE